MELKLEGLEEFYSDGVLNPAAASPIFQQNCTKYRSVGPRVFLLYEPKSPTTKNSEGTHQCVEPEFDIVLLHGINSDEFACWTNKQGVLWPAVFLPQDFPTARVLTVGYAHSLFNWKNHSDADDTYTSHNASPVPLSDATLEDSVPHSSHLALSRSKRSGGDEGSNNHSGWDAFGEKGPLAALSGYAPKIPSGEAWRVWWNQNGEKPPSEKVEDTSTVLGDTFATASTHATLVAEPSEHAGGLFHLMTQSKGPEVEQLLSSGGSPSTANREAAAKARDPRSMQSMRLVAADLAERLLHSEVGVGSRPVIFIAHSMGGLIVKHLLVGLFDATRSTAGTKHCSSINIAEAAAKAVSVSSCDLGADGTACDTEALREELQKANRLLHQVRAVVFYGTPHFGSALASVITGLKRYYQGIGGLTPTGVVTGLGDHNKEELTCLNDRFLDLTERLRDVPPTEGWGGTLRHAGRVSDAKAKEGADLMEYAAVMEGSLSDRKILQDLSGTAGLCSFAFSILSFGETQKQNGLIRVVDPESSNPAPDDPRFPFFLVDSDHSGVNRPMSKTSPSYSMLYGFIDRMQQRGRLRNVWEPTAAFSFPMDPEAATKDAARKATLRHLQGLYEVGWASLFDPQAEQDQGITGHSNRHVWNCSNAYERGYSEAQTALQFLNEAIGVLQVILRRFFGVSVPPELDLIFVLASDMSEFAMQFYQVKCYGSREALLLDEVVTFTVSLQLLTYWTRRAIDTFNTIEVSQLVRGDRTNPVTEFRSNMGVTDSPQLLLGDITRNVPGSRDIREVYSLQKKMRIVQEEWEGFRRYVSLHTRATIDHESSPSHTRTVDSSGIENSASAAPLPTDCRIQDHIGVLFFSRSIESIVSEHSMDGGVLGNIMNTYLFSAIEQIRNGTQHLNSVAFERSPWTPLLSSTAPSVDTVIGLIMEGLELAGSSTRKGGNQGSILVDTSTSCVTLSPGELRGIIPALTAASSVLLGCYCLFVKEYRYFCKGERLQSASHSFWLAITSLEKDSHIRARLRRIAAEMPPQLSNQGRLSRMTTATTEEKNIQREWWWRSGSSSSADVPQRAMPLTSLMDGPHIGKLDDGLLLSSMELVTWTFRCRVCLLEMQPLMGRKTLQSDAASLASRTNGEEVFSRLLNCVQTVQRTYKRTQYLLHNVSAENVQSPYGPAPDMDSQTGKKHAVVGDTRATTMARVTLRDTIRNALKELEQINEIDLEKGNSTDDGSSSSPASSLRNLAKRKEKEKGSSVSLPHFILSSLAKAWEAVRCGDTAPETPESFAVNALVMWWTVEAEAVDVLIRYMEKRCQQLSPSSTTSNSSRAGGAGLCSALNAIRTTHEGRYRGFQDALVRTSPLTDSHSQQQITSSMEKWNITTAKWERDYWKRANAQVRCQWMTAQGGLKFLKGYQGRMAAQRQLIQSILESSSLKQLASLPLSSESEGEAGTSAGLPGVLLDALQLDESNLHLRCWIGHCYSLHQMYSSDATHAYLQMVRSASPNEADLQHTAMVGLAWNRLHQIHCTAVKRLVPSTLTTSLRSRIDSKDFSCFSATAAGEETIESSGARNRSFPSDRYSSKDRDTIFFTPAIENTVVIDRAAMGTVPLSFLSFCRRAATHHAASVESYIQATASEPSTHGSFKAGASPRSELLSISFPSPPNMLPSVKHLLFVEESFLKVLKSNPSDVGALCGLGRLRCLSVAGASPTNQFSCPPFFSPTASVAEMYPGTSQLATNTEEAVRFFSAALDASNSTSSCASSATPMTCREMMNCRWCSYAAHWIGELTRTSTSSSSFTTSPEAEWYRQALQYCPTNDWALTNLGLLFIQTAQRQSLTLNSPENDKRYTPWWEANKEMEAHRGVALLSRALVINPRNTWALWGAATYSMNTELRQSCQRQLRSILCRGV